MRLSLIFTFFTILQTAASVFSQNVSIDVKDQSMREVLKKIETQSNYRFFYNDQLSGLNTSVTLKADNKSVKEILEELLAGQQLSFRLLENNMIVIAPNEIAQQQKITGTVTDATTGDPLIGVSIAVEGTTQGTISDANGKFTIESVNPNAVLIFSYIGYNVQKVSITGQSTVNVKMESDMTKLDEIVVVGYGVQKKKLATGATLQVKGDQLQKLNTVNTMNAMQGITPGVQIVKSSGQPGEGYKVNIRGKGTNSDPTPLFIVDGIATGNIDYLSPSDIESVDILKDAASAAIYGSRAANGVILVTTKKGKSGKMMISYDGYYGAQNLYKKAPLLDAKEYAMIMSEAMVNSGLNPPDFSTQVPHWADIQSGKNKGTNWLDLITAKNAPQQGHNLTISGGNERSTYLVGLGYLSQEGILGKPVASKYSRYNFRLNSDHAVIKNGGLDILKVGENIAYSYSEKSGIAVGGIYNNDIHNMLITNPLQPNLADTTSDPAYPYHYSIPWAPFSANPIAVMVDQRGLNLTKNHDINGNIYFELTPIKRLTWKSSFGITVNANSYRSYSPAYNQSTITVNSDNVVRQNMGVTMGWTFQNFLTYDIPFFDKHHLNVVAGTEASKSGLGESINASNSNMTFNDFDHAYLTNASSILAGKTSVTGGAGNPYTINNINYYRGPSALLSYFGRINYDFKETYLLTLVLRTDGSSNFASGKRWGTFPSVSAGWVATNESFLKENNVLQFLKFRGSWGQNGNQNVYPFQYLSTVGFGDPFNYFFGTSKTTVATGGYPNILPNPDISWEISQQTDLGFDARFLGGRLTLTFDYYDKATKDLLIQAPILLTAGANAPFINGGDVSNKGIEIAAGWNGKIGELTYSISANIANNKNKVTKIANTEGIIHGPANVLSQGTTEMFRMQVGYPIGYFWGFKTAGIFQTPEDVKAYKNSNDQVILPNAQPGDVKFVDLNNDGIIDDKDKTQIGDPNPHYTYGFNITANYKGFDFSVLANGVSGNQIAKSYRSFADSWQQNYTTDILSRWHGEGSSNKLPRVISGVDINTQYISDLYIEDGAYLRISNITLGYDFKKLFKKIPFGQTRLYVSVQNLYTFTKYSGMDPEIGYTPDLADRPSGSGFSQGIDLGFYPSPRTVIVGANIKF